MDKLPKSEYDLAIQAKKAAKSVSANMAEGFAKRFSEKEFRRYLMISLASNDEVIAHLRNLIIVAPKFSLEANQILIEYKTLSKRINTLHRNWRFAPSSGSPIH